ncbi:hypothetical protein [Sphingomonas japonica]|uniref:Uncharacterized protein n=1 Tax=Sphingomonas japonica TaxID=511662 RepID=A0ABX0U5S6_9SPHN|nr:hypothetical protein [Sphingomonas japonica]NIJ25219.1 hypothetical protein [Sphingomonas japonica]
MVLDNQPVNTDLLIERRAAHHRRMDDTLRLLASRTLGHDEALVSADDLSAWSIERGETVVDFLDHFGAEIAKSYHVGELSYAFCDSIVNDLWGLLLQQTVDDSAASWPHTFYRVYDAFDAGEYNRRADGTDDPVAEFTDPAIEEIVAMLRRQELESGKNVASDG